MKRIISPLIILLLISGCKTASIEDDGNKQKAVLLLKALETGDKAAIEYINPNKYIQHNLAVPDGVAGFTDLLQRTVAARTKVNIVRCFEDGAFVFAHTSYTFGQPTVGFDIFRFEDGKIVEHWDNLQAATKPNPSGRTLVDGPIEIKDLDKTAANKILVQSFVDEALMHGRMEKISSYFNEDNYVQHNPAVADNVSGLKNALVEWGKQGITMKYDSVHKVLGEGNFVLVVSEGHLAGKHVSFYDLFRVEKEKIAEHWDTIEEIPPKSTWKNDNGKF